jgi:hypothetical protein
MDWGARLMRGGIIIAAFFVVCAWPATNAARGEQTSGAQPAPSDPALLDLNLSKFSNSGPDYGLSKLELGKFRKDTPELAFPDSIDLGGHLLRLDTSRNVVDFVPRAVTDAPDLSDIIMPVRSSKKRSRSMQSYFGLTFTTPTH